MTVQLPNLPTGASLSDHIKFFPRLQIKASFPVEIPHDVFQNGDD